MSRCSKLYRFEDEHVSAEISAMRSLVTRLRSDSIRMLKSLNELTERNATLEREAAEHVVFRKGAELEIESLRREMLLAQTSLEEERRVKKEVEAKLEELKTSGDLSIKDLR